MFASDYDDPVIANQEDAGAYGSNGDGDDGMSDLVGLSQQVSQLAFVVQYASQPASASSQVRRTCRSSLVKMIYMAGTCTSGTCTSG